MHFSTEERARYDRHFRLKKFGIEGQMRLKAAKVLVIGAGGLGCPCLQYLAAAGVGYIGIVDGDVVDLSNLQRQVLFGKDDIGQPKALVAQRRLAMLNDTIRIMAYPMQLVNSKARALFAQYDLIIDATDNFPTRYLINDACVLENKPYIYGAIHQFSGQVAIFNGLNEDGFRTATYRDIFPNPPAPEDSPSCAEAGVLGVLPGIIGSMQASEAIKYITGLGQPLMNKLWLFDALAMQAQSIGIQPNPDTPVIKELMNYQQFCNPNMNKNKPQEVEEVSVETLQEWQAANKDIFLLDVREPFEAAVATLGGQLIPLGQLEQHIEKIDRSKLGVVYCRKGLRSATAIQILQEKYQFTNLVNLKGGIAEYLQKMPVSKK